MIAALKRLVGLDPRTRLAEATHAIRTAELEAANRALEELNERLNNVGELSRREGLALASSIEELGSQSQRVVLVPGVELTNGPQKA